MYKKKPARNGGATIILFEVVNTFLLMILYNILQL